MSVSSKEYDGIHKYLRITDIDEKSRKFNKDKLTSPDIKFNSSSKKYLLSNNDIVFARTGASTGKTYMYQKEDGIVYYAGFLIKASLSSNFDNNFIFQQTYRKRYYQRVKVISQRSGQPGINSKEYGNFDFLITQIEEQNKIGKLFKIFDNLLALYENKRKLLTALFQGLSQYLFIFSKEKNAIQMSLSSITLSETKGIAKENSLSSGNIEYLDTTRLNGGKAKLVSGKKDVDFRDIIVLWDGSNAGKIYYGFSGILGSTLKVFKLKDDINSEYVYYYLKFKQNLILHKFRTPNIPHVSKDFSQRFTLPIPSKERQNLIANILHLNELQINLINKKIEKLKQIKKSLLQNIFL